MLGWPEVEVLLSPSPVFPGHALVAEVRFASKKAIRTRGVDLRLVGTERYLDESAPSHIFLEQRATFDDVKLPKGSQALRARFEVPPGAPPTVSGKRARIDYELRLNVDLKWWPDLDRVFVVPVARPAAAPNEATTVFSSHPDGKGRLPYAEATLSTTCVSPGKVFSGAMSFSNLGQHAERARPYLAFVCTEARAGEPGAVTTEYEIELGDTRVEEGAAIPFRVRFPEGASRSFQGYLGSIRWTMDVRLRTGRSPSRGTPLMSLPIEVGDYHESASRSAPAVAIGQRRRAAVWRAEGTRLGMRFDDARSELSATVGQVRVEVSAEVRPSSGPAIISRLSFPRFGCDVELGPRTLLSRLRWGEAKLGDSALERLFVASARDGELLRRMLEGELSKVLAECEGLTLLDASATMEEPGAGFDGRALGGHLSKTMRLAAAIDATLSRLPHPPGLEAESRVFGDLARGLGGRFVAPAISVDAATLRGVVLDAGLVFRPPSRPDAVFVRAFASAPDRVAAALASEKGQALSTALTAHGDVRLGEVHGGRSGASAVSFVTESAEVSATRLESWIEQVVALVELGERDGERGPYR
jgi:hypothetical protein